MMTMKGFKLTENTKNIIVKSSLPTNLEITSITKPKVQKNKKVNVLVEYSDTNSALIFNIR